MAATPPGESCPRWIARPPASLAFAPRGGPAELTPDRTIDDEGNVANRFPGGVGRVPLAEVRYRPLAQGDPGDRR